MPQSDEGWERRSIHVCAVRVRRVVAALVRHPPRRRAVAVARVLVHQRPVVKGYPRHTHERRAGLYSKRLVHRKHEEYLLYMLLGKSVHWINVGWNIGSLYIKSSHMYNKFYKESQAHNLTILDAMFIAPVT